MEEDSLYDSLDSDVMNLMCPASLSDTLVFLAMACLGRQYWGSLYLLMKLWSMQLIPDLESAKALVMASLLKVFLKMVRVKLKHLDFLSVTITHFTHLDCGGILCIREELLFKNPLQRF